MIVAAPTATAVPPGHPSSSAMLKHLFAFVGFLACGFLVLLGAEIPARPVPGTSPTPAPGETTVEFSFQPSRREAAAIKEVNLAGDFNHWDAFETPLAKGADGVFRVQVPLKPGEYLWRFYFNGSCVHDMQAIARQCAPKTGRCVEHRSGGKVAVAIVR